MARLYAHQRRTEIPKGRFEVTGRGMMTHILADAVRGDARMGACRAALEVHMRLALTSVFVNDVEEAFRFYTGVLGFLPKVHMPEAGLAVVVSPEDPDGCALLLEPNASPIAAGYQKALREAGLPCLVLGAKDVAAEHDRLKERGVTFRQEPTRTDWGTLAVFDDTCGNWIQIHQP